MIYRYQNIGVVYIPRPNLHSTLHYLSWSTYMLSKLRERTSDVIYEARIVSAEEALKRIEALLRYHNREEGGLGLLTDQLTPYLAPSEDFRVGQLNNHPILIGISEHILNELSVLTTDMMTFLCDTLDRRLPIRGPISPGGLRSYLFCRGFDSLVSLPAHLVAMLSASNTPIADLLHIAVDMTEYNSSVASWVCKYSTATSRRAATIAQYLKVSHVFDKENQS